GAGIWPAAHGRRGHRHRPAGDAADRQRIDPRRDPVPAVEAGGLIDDPASPDAYRRTALCSIHATNASRNFFKKSRVESLTSFPWSSKRPAAPPMYASGCCRAGMFRKTSDCRRWWFAPNAPIAPGDTLITAAGFPFHALLP